MSEPHVPPEAAASEAPVCYRHTDRETYIRCSRCDRPICPDCMTSAAVGFQCPECVADGRRTQPAARTIAGARITGRPAVVTGTLIGVCVAVYALQVGVQGFTSRFWLLGVDVAGGETYRLVTAGFLHGGVSHLLLNMWALWVFGQPVEALLGRARFLTTYLVALVAGTTASYVFDGALTPSLGASGAIFGIVGAMIVLGKRLRMPLGWVIGFAALNIAFTVVVSGIDWHAHLGGLVGGMVVAAALVYSPPRYRVLAWAGGSLAVLVLLAGVVAWRTQQIQDDIRTGTIQQLGARGAQPPVLDLRPSGAPDA